MTRTPVVHIWDLADVNPNLACGADIKQGGRRRWITIGSLTKRTPRRATCARCRARWRSRRASSQALWARVQEQIRRKLMPLALPNEGAIFNDDRTRRWWLGRCLDRVRGVHRGRLLIIAVQPSTADETANDPTITREIKFATSWGFLWLDKCNLFDLCSPDPSTLYGSTPPVLPVNDEYILAAAERATLILCAWGNHGAHLARGARMRRLLIDRGYQLHALGFTKDGHPIHPLARGKSRVPDSAQPQRWP